MRRRPQKKEAPLLLRTNQFRETDLFPKIKGCLSWSKRRDSHETDLSEKEEAPLLLLTPFFNRNLQRKLCTLTLFRAIQ